MWARIHAWARPIRQTRTFLRTQRRNSKRMIRPPATPKTKPGKLLPPGHSAAPTPSERYQPVAATRRIRQKANQRRCRCQLARSISTTRSSKENRDISSTESGICQRARMRKASFSENPEPQRKGCFAAPEAVFFKHASRSTDRRWYERAHTRVGIAGGSRGHPAGVLVRPGARAGVQGGARAHRATADNGKHAPPGGDGFVCGARLSWPPRAGRDEPFQTACGSG